MRRQMITANLLEDGATVYLRADRQWVADPEDALASEDAAVIDALVAWAKTQSLVVLDPYSIEVELGPQGVRQLSARERIRAAGPLVMLARLGYATAEDAPLFRAVG